ncbi:LPS assembly lipoprotein LptE [Vibrio hannami]|uniref:LPS-assembly lipoprotein LptE n=1 Tax=Vibrio hannami TaxID=2717094 RepID=UPI0024108564|nr:LPS assembly lipoprotein LptE [Vibrio hannami]MDG3087416.1 LPS assembly lipoprotein LptE [Vibrio hannami]
MKSLLSAFPTKLSIVLLLAGTLSACGFHFRGSYQLPEEISDISMTSYDQYSSLTRAVKNQLRLNGITTVTPAENVSNIHLMSGSLGERTISLYQNGQAAEKELTYSASYRVTIPEIGTKTFTTTAYRTYLTNPQTALAKSVEEEMLEQEMVEQSAIQIIRQMARLKYQLEHNELTAEEFDELSESKTSEQETLN